MSVNIENVIGHVVEAEITLTGYFGSSKQIKKGRIIYSTYQNSLFFLPTGSRSKGFIIDETAIHSVEIVKKDKSKHEEYLTLYRHREQLEKEQAERRQREWEERNRLEKERRDRKRELEIEKREKEINEAKELGGYDELEQEVITYYKSFEDANFNESYVKNTVVPLLNKLINKGISNVNEYPKYYFDKKHNPKMCALIEKKLSIKLLNTQKGNVEKLNQYLVS